jgi:FkbM family methyltransferase
MKKIIKQFIPPIFIKLLKPKRKGRPSTYMIGDDVLDLPAEHTLPIYQGKHKLFDRFLPVLASFVKKGDIIIDIGANVGDTAIMMCQNSDSQIICVEPSDKFFPYLERNISKLGSEREKQFLLKKALIGSDKFAGHLQHYGGTAKVVVDDQSNKDPKVELDVLIGDEQIGLIKVDTDGFDFDVLNSGLKVLERSRPMLFWENQIENADQEKGYKALYKNLADLGYSWLYIFDNFGNLILELADFKALENINNYTTSMNEYGCTRTFYFTDVLAVADNYKDAAAEAVEKYKAEWIRK